MKNGFSVIMPTYNQATFIRNAIKSLLDQTISEWELIIINDGATDETYEYIQDFLSDTRITYIENKKNRGLGEAINQGLDISHYKYIAYLPSDDFYYRNHLETLKNELDKSDDIILTYVKARSEIKDSLLYDIRTQINGLFHNHSLQLVQTAHRNTSDRWVERREWISKDYFLMFWNKLIDKGVFSFIDKETASWTIHNYQYHNLINGGINRFRQYYNVQEPIKMKISKHRFIDEEKLYKDYKRTSTTISNKKTKLKILLVGELAYHPERIYALEEYGCELYGLWMRNPTFDFTTVGPLPFGNIIDVPFENWKSKVKEIKPDIIYACLNFSAVPFAHEVMTECTEIPFVWHFKEGPFVCRNNGTWEKLINLYNKANGKIYLSEETKIWYEQFIPKKGLSFLLDGDLPKINYFTDKFSKRLSESDKETHVVVPGRLIGLNIDNLRTLANNNIHIHLHIRNNHDGIREDFYQKALAAIPDHFHIHSHIEADDWTKEFSKYDAGWLHSFTSENHGDYKRCTWNDLNIPARISTLATAGLPMIQQDNFKHIVATQSITKKYNIGLFYNKIEDLALQLKDQNLMDSLRNNVRKNRLRFSFDYHVPALIEFFQKVINSKNG